MRILLRLAVLGIALALTTAAHSQALRDNPRLQARLTQAKLREIQKTLLLGEEKMKALGPIYARYDSVLNSIHLARLAKPRGTDPQGLSPEEADGLVTRQLDNAVRLSTVRRDFYPEFKAVLTPQQVMALFRAEAQIRRRVMLEMRRRMESRAK